ncbi:transposase [Nonomuraea angiospora]|uniref:transposase n=1 Tax=Nonomuraea angiospora TaxID=46172 RepID=UPI003417C7F7
MGADRALAARAEHRRASGEASTPEIVNGVLYVVRSGCPWRYLPTDLPPWQFVYWYFQQWEQIGITEALLTELRIKPAVRRPRQGADGRHHRLAKRQGCRWPSAVTAVVTTRARVSTAASDSSSPTPPAQLLTVAMMTVSRQDRDGAKAAQLSAYVTTPIRHVFADQGFAGTPGGLGP